VPAINAAPQKDSDAANQKTQTQSSSDTDAHANQSNNPQQSIAPAVIPASVAAQTRASQTPAASNVTGTNRAAGRDAKTQTAPAVATTDTSAVVTVGPVQIAQVSALPVPSPNSARSGDNSSAQNGGPVIATLEAQTDATSTTAVRTVSLPAASGNQNQPAKSAASDVKFAVEMFDPSLGDAAKSDQQKDSSASQKADATSTSSPQTDSSPTPPDQSNGSSSGQTTHAARQPLPQIVATTALPNQPNDSLSGQATSTASTPSSQAVAPVALPLSGMSLPDFNALPSTSSVTQPSANATQSGNANNASLPKTAAITNAAGAATNGQTTSATAPVSSSTHTAQNNAQGNSAQSNASNNGSGQHTQSQTVQNQPAPQATANSASVTPQIQTVPTHSAQHDSFASHLSSDGTVDASRSSDKPAQAESNETLPSAGINTANVIQKMNETEMRVGMHSAEFGDISIRTSVSQQQMVTHISVDHSDLGKAISAHIPTLETKLSGEFGIRATVQVSESGMSFSGDRNSSPQQDQRTFVQPAVIESAEPSMETYSVLPHVAAVAGDSYRLDIRA
jgi:hypothetical protein